MTSVWKKHLNIKTVYWKWRREHSTSKWYIKDNCRKK